MYKRMADWLELISVAAFAVAVLRDLHSAFVVCALAFILSMWLASRAERAE
ncbi:MAG: hypothetical protein Q4F72_11585 [Desulfovibrionaceae bacterium]|nr:hypothetical protein [Desulfovibrionaceae bacterium]